MPKKQTLTVENLRHAEYYNMQHSFDCLYEDSKNGKIFDSLMCLILSEENILLAYRNLKSNKGSNTPGTDGVTIRDIGRLSSEEVVNKVRFILTGSVHGYRPKPVRRKDIPKPNGSTRPLGIPCMWDRLVQQCIKQVLEPICEAKFSDNSYGFRPNRSVENAISSCYKHMQRDNYHYVIEFDIKGFFDNVNHSKLIKQIWALGIRDKKLIYIIKQILKAEIRMPNGEMLRPQKGTPQGGIISPLLANIVLNELDKWIESQWQNHPLIQKYTHDRTSEGKGIDRGSGYRSGRTTKLKEMLIVRYADDFRIFCKDAESAKKTLIATTMWLKERLKLEVSPEKTRIVNLERDYSEFLGFKMRLRKKRGKLTVESHMCDKAIAKEIEALIKQINRLAKPKDISNELKEIRRYNSMVMGIHNYYSIATDINLDAQKLHLKVDNRIFHCMQGSIKARLDKVGRELSVSEKKSYGKSKMLRFAKATKEPIYPIGYVQTRHPLAKSNDTCCYTPEGRERIHKNLRINTELLAELMVSPQVDCTVEFNDNKLSLFSAQMGKCSVTGITFMSTDEIHCHHKTPRSAGGTDAYQNLTLVLETVHKLIHAKNQITIDKYMCVVQPDNGQLKKINLLRSMAGMQVIAST